MATAECITKCDLSPTIEKSLQDIIRNEGFIKHMKYERAINTNGGNYLGDLFEVDIKGKTTDGDKETNLFIKRIIDCEGINIISAEDLQNREILAYRDLYTLCTELMDGAGVPECDRFQQVKCYDANSEVLIFENLAVKGFKTLDRTTPLTLEYAELAIKQLAKFHGLSFVLQKKRPEYFNARIKTLDFPIVFNDEYYDLLHSFFDITCELLEGDAAKKVKASFDKIFNLDKFFQSHRQRVLCHGDYRTNNLLVKEIEGKLVDIMPVDFQIIYFGNPMNDFFYLLVPHSDQEFRRKHLSYLKELYYETLTRFLKYFGIDAATAYSRQDLDSDYEESIGYGLCSSMMLLSFLFSREDATPNVNELQDLNKKVSLQDGAKDRIRGIVDDYINWGII